jgi:hypothetical protein
VNTSLVRECLELILMLADASDRKQTKPPSTVSRQSLPVTPKVAPVVLGSETGRSSADAILQAAWRCWRRCAGSSAACRAASAPPTPIGQFASTPVPVPERPSVVHLSLYPPEPVYEVRRKIDPSVVQRLLSGLSAIMTAG